MGEGSRICEDTRGRIVDHSIELFSQYGYENVGLRQIADVVGIKAASIYNHFPGKEHILEEIYTTYDAMLTTIERGVDRQARENTLQQGSAAEILQMLTGAVVNLPVETYCKMVKITRIIIARFMIGGSANHILLQRLLQDGIDRAMAALVRLEELGRLAPGFEATAFAETLTHTMLSVEVTGFACSGYSGTPEKRAAIRGMLGDYLSRYLLAVDGGRMRVQRDGAGIDPVPQSGALSLHLK